jgi:hypothetical protein
MFADQTDHITDQYVAIIMFVLRPRPFDRFIGSIFRNFIDREKVLVAFMVGGWQKR